MMTDFNLGDKGVMKSEFKCSLCEDCNNDYHNCRTYFSSIKTKGCFFYTPNNLLELKFKNDKEDRFYGGLFGAAIGDALGVPVEFKKREELSDDLVLDMRGWGVHNQPFGTWSDDTSMTLCLVNALANHKGLQGVSNNFLKWYKRGNFTATGEVFDIGNTCLTAIENMMLGCDLSECGSKDVKSNGNGSLMRILPLAFYDKLDYGLIEDVASLTHAHKISVLGCLIYVIFAHYLFIGETLGNAYDKLLHDLSTEYFDKYNDVKYCYQRILDKSIISCDVSNVKSSGYVVDTLEAAFWCLFRVSTYNSCVLKAVNLGLDTDTVGCVTGGLAGIYYGYSKINNKWVQMLQEKYMLYEEYLSFWLSLTEGY
jgi:ADP-ribosylglycohydrolase